MKDKIKDNEDLEIKKVTVNEINLKKLLDNDFVDKLDENVENYTLLNLQLILDGEKPSQLVTIGHALGGDYKDNRLTINAESEENLELILKLLSEV